MASGSAEDQWRVGRRHHGDLDGEPPEEGEVDAGCHSETDTEDYYNGHSPIDSGETVSDCDCETATSSAAVVPANGGGGGDASTSSSFAKGCSRLASMVAVSPNAVPDQPMAAEFLQPMPLAFATPKQSLPSMPTPMASARANLSGQSGGAPPPPHGYAMEIAVAGASNPPPAEATGGHQQPIAPPAAAAVAGWQNPRGYTCKRCGMWFRNHQGLGGHMVGHKNSDLAAAAASAAGTMLLRGSAAVPAAAGHCRRNRSRPERPHVCDECGAAFRLGVQLGGHKRKHWAGAPIVPKKKKPRAVVDQPLPPPEEAVADLALVMPVRAADEAAPAPPVAMELARPAAGRTPEPAPRPAAAGRVLLFGIDIGPGVQATVELTRPAAGRTSEPAPRPATQSSS